MNAALPLTRRILLIIAAVLAVLLALAAILATVTIRRPIPAHSGSLDVGVEQEVTIQRDAQGTPHIYAHSDHDLFYAQGYVHAQDRFFEMDYRRHVTAGRLSELVGENEAALEADTVIRTMGWYRTAEQEWDLISEESQSIIRAYTDGVNAYVSEREASELGIEYTVLGLQVSISDPEPWTPVDTLAWLKAMAWDLRNNYSDELERASTYQAVGDLERVDEVFPAYPYDVHAPIVTTADSPTDATDTDGPVTSDVAEALGSDALDSAVQALAAVPEMIGEGDGIGSNSFVVSGEHTASGQPILANDPHLSLAMPSVWYQVGLHCVEVSDTCTFDVGGFSFAGMPGVIIGHNSDLAWGLTNMGADVTDFFLERTYPDDTYEMDGERLPMQIIEETIHVNGGDDVPLTVRVTEHGPIVSDAITVAQSVRSTPVPAGSPPGGLDGYEVSLSWTALQPGRSVEAIFALNRATNADEVQAAAALFEVPAQNIVFATVDGDIGYQAPGRIPIRAAADGPIPSDGTWPRPGWDSAYNWQGFIPSEELPRVLNPEEGFIVAANQAVTADGVEPFLAEDYDPGFRSNRIRELLNGMIEAGETLDVAGANEIMLDSKNPLAEALVPAILRLDFRDPFIREALDELRVWRDAGYPNDTNSAGAAFFNTIYAFLLKATFGDEIGEAQGLDGGSRWIHALAEMMTDPGNKWWDDITTATITENRDEVLRTSITQARELLTRVLGKDPSSWEWGALHQGSFDHAILSPDAAPGAIAWLFNPADFPVSGGTATVNANNFSATFDERGRPVFTVTSGPSMRMVVDMSDLDTATWVTTTGNSGHPWSGHYTDQIAAWRDGDTFPWAWSEEAVSEAAKATLTLNPAG